MKFDILIDEIVKNTAKKVKENGAYAIEAGNNGPYYDVETPVRNMAHWCVTFSEYYKKTGDEIYKDNVIVLADAILNSKDYNGSGVYKCREIKRSDEVNGVIGPAWIIEGLIYAAGITGDERYYERAKEIFLVVPFNDRLSIWQRYNTKNQSLSVDTTFNHQLWFAAAGAMIDNYKHDEEIAIRVNKFISAISKNITIRKDGRIGHFTMNDKNGILGYFGRVYRDLRNDVLDILGKPSLSYKEAGYHVFNLYGFTILKNNSKTDIPFLSSKKFRKALEYVSNEEYFNALNSADKTKDETRVGSKIKQSFNVFSYAYNSPAFELKRVYNDFGLKNDKTDNLFERFCDKQIEITFNEETGLFDKNTDDGVTLTTRIYEYITES